MGKSSKLLKSFILGAKAFSKDRSGSKKEQSNKTRSQWSLRKSYSCGYEPDDDTEEQIDHDNRQVASGIVNDLQSDTTLGNPTNENSEYGLSETVEKPDNGELLAEEEGAYISRSTDEISMEENAAIVIQSAFRGFLCRRAFGALKDTRLQDLENGRIPRNQTAMDSRCMQALIKVQARVRARQVQMSEEGQTVHQQIQQKRQLRAYYAKSQEDWDYSLDTVDRLHAKQQNKHEAAMRRERALAYAFSQQLRICGQRKTQQAAGDYSHQDQQTHLGWTWLERWMAARPSDNIADLEKDIKKNPYPSYMHDKNEDATPPPPPQYGKIRRKKKTTDKKPIHSPTRSLPYNMKSPNQLQAKINLPRTPAKSSTSSGHESPNDMGDLQSGTIASHHVITRKQLIFGDEAEESCGSNALCSSPDVKAKVDSDHNSKGGSHDPKLQGGGKHKSSEKGPTNLRIPNYMSTTQSSKAKVHHHSNEPTKPKQAPITAKSASTTALGSTTL